MEKANDTRDRWLLMLVLSIALNVGVLILFPLFVTDGLTPGLAVICGVPALWGGYALLFFRTRRERVVGYASFVPAILWSIVLALIASGSQQTPVDEFAGMHCIARLKMIDGCKATWALEQKKTNTDAPTWDDLRSYISPTRVVPTPTCPQGGVYRTGRVFEKPTCSYHGHTL